MQTNNSRYVAKCTLYIAVFLFFREKCRIIYEISEGDKCSPSINQLVSLWVVCRVLSSPWRSSAAG